MSIEYVSQDEIEAHEAAMQRVVEDEKKERKAINDKKKRAIEAAKQQHKMTIKAAEEKMRKTIEAAQKEADQTIQVAKRKADKAIKAAENESFLKLVKEKNNKEKKLAAMQRDFKCLPLLRQVYHEAPNDVFELIVSKCSDKDVNGWGLGGLNAFRLVNKRCKQVVESCTTMLVNQQEVDGPDSLPIPIIQRCRRIEWIACFSHNLRSLEGCPNGLRVLFIGQAPHLSDLSPLASCSMMESLGIRGSSITDISVVALMPLLEEFACQKGEERPSVKDLSPLSSCPRLTKLYLYGNNELKDLSPLSICMDLELL